MALHDRGNRYEFLGRHLVDRRACAGTDKRSSDCMEPGKLETETAATNCHFFVTLSTSRGSARLSPQHVNALNLIRVAFYKEKSVTRACSRYMEHMNGRPQPGQELAHSQKGDERLLDLLATLASALGYHFDKTDLENFTYTPQGWLDDEIQLRDIKNELAKLLKKESFLWISVLPPAPTPENSSTEESSTKPPGQP